MFLGDIFHHNSIYILMGGGREGERERGREEEREGGRKEEEVVVSQKSP